MRNLVILVLVVVIVLVACAPSVDVVGASGKARIIEIEGMTCLAYYDYVWESSGITCNWAEYKGSGS